jgi:hypothetical protein
MLAGDRITRAGHILTRRRTPQITPQRTAQRFADISDKSNDADSSMTGWCRILVRELFYDRDSNEYDVLLVDTPLAKPHTGAQPHSKPDSHSRSRSEIVHSEIVHSERSDSEHSDSERTQRERAFTYQL